MVSCAVLVLVSSFLLYELKPHSYFRTEVIAYIYSWLLVSCFLVLLVVLAARLVVTWMRASSTKNDTFFFGREEMHSC